jgi:catechol 2,3-dioxygenase-like lactoylglutathione lyase family enzyme
MKLERVIVFTPDAARLAEFYRSAFGLEPIGESGTDWIELEGGGCSIAFHTIAENSTVRDGWIKLAFGTPKVAEEKARLEDLGVRMSDITSFDGIDLCDGTDPDGNRFQISSRGM